MGNDKKGFSDADNEQAGRLLMMGVFLVVGIVILMVAPIAIGGFAIGLIWYGAYMEDGEPNGEKLAWPIAITLAVFLFLFGAPVGLTRYFEGVLFTDFGEWTSRQVWDVLGTVNGFLPRKMEIRNITVDRVRFYAWALIPAACASFYYLHRKAAGRGVFIYQAFFAALTPLRVLAVRWQWVFGLAGVFALSSLIFHMPYWARQGFALTFLPLLVYMFIVYKREEKSLAKLVTQDGGEPRVSGPILLGSVKGSAGNKVRLTEDQLNHHVHIVGASGFGKSVLLSHVIQNRIASGSGLLFVDLKADFETIRQVASNAKASGRMNDLYIFSCGNPEISSSYNVLSQGTANQLKDRIMGALNWSEEFYKNEASSFLLKLLRGLTYLRDQGGAAVDLATVLKCTESPRPIEAMIERLPKSELELTSQLEDLVSSLGKPEKYKALQGLRSQLEALVYSDIGHLLTANADGIDLFEAIAKKKIVYVLLDSRTYGESARALGKLILQDLKAASARIDNEIPRAARTPFTVVVDEFSDLATEEFLGFLDRARSSKIGVVVAHQEIADLSRISPEFSHRLMNSTSTLFAFLQKVPQTSDLIASISGTKTTTKITEQAQSNWLFGDEKTGMKSIREVDEFVIHPNTVRSLAVGECVMVTKYPKSSSVVVKIRPEAQGYLSADEVRSVLMSSCRGFTKQQSRITRPSRAAVGAERSDREKETDKF
jgi:hypothetical protein